MKYKLKKFKSAEAHKLATSIFNQLEGIDYNDLARAEQNILHMVADVPRMLKDASDVYLPCDDVWELAYNNALNSGEGTGAALRRYIDNMDDDALLQWATDENGNFTEKALARFAS